jgi:hypothetical protein
MLDIKIGCDPELFAYSETARTPVSVHSLLPGTKWNPVRVPKGAIQVDGVAAEFNIDPASTENEFIDNISHVRRLLDLVLSSKSSDLKLYATPCAFFQVGYFNGLPETVKALGCEPDFNAYTGKPNPKPETNEPFRTGSGHIHIGWTDGIEDPQEEQHFNVCCEIVRELDFVLYNSSIQWDKEDKRRELYGAPGAFRPKKYGLEYRVLSNAWLNAESTQRFVYAASKAVSMRYFKGFKPVSELFNYHPLKFNDYCEFLSSQRLPNIKNFMAAHSSPPISYHSGSNAKT